MVCRRHVVLIAWHDEVVLSFFAGKVVIWSKDVVSVRWSSAANGTNIWQACACG